MKLSLVVPCYNEQNNVLPFYEACRKSFDGKDYEYEIIFINDGSKDETWIKLKSIYERANNIKLVNFSRNFGKESAMYAGLQRADGDYVTIIDADLQQRPELVNDMIVFLEANPGYDAVALYQEKRNEGRIISGLKNLFYKIANKYLEVDFKAGASDFRTFRKAVVNAVLSLTEYHRFSKGIFSWVGFNTYYMPYIAQKRNAGNTSWSFLKLFKYACRGFTAFSTFPLRLATIAGALSSLFSLIYIFVVLFEHWFMHIQPPGYATIVFLVLFIGGIQLIMLGIIGEYISRIFIESKRRPIYIEKEYLTKENVDNKI